MHKGIVMNISGTTGIVMTVDGQFIKIAKLPASCNIGDEIPLPVVTRRNRLALRYSAAAACFAAMVLLFLFSTGFWESHQAAAAYISMDINPSIELSVGANERIIQAEGVDEAGRTLLKRLKLKGKTLEEAALIILNEAERLHYLDSFLELGEGSILITGLAMDHSDDSLEKKLITQMKTAVHEQLETKYPDQQENIVVAGISVPAELRDKAKHTGLSTGKLAIQLLAEEQGYHVATESLSEQSIHHLSASFGGIKQLLGNQEEDEKARLAQLIEKRNSGDAAPQQPADKNEGTVPEQTKPLPTKDELEQIAREKREKQEQEKREKQEQEKREKQEQEKREKQAKELEDKEKERQKQLKQQQKEAEEIKKRNAKEEEKRRQEAEKNEEKKRKELEKLQKEQEKEAERRLKEEQKKLEEKRKEEEKQRKHEEKKRQAELRKKAEEERAKAKEMKERKKEERKKREQEKKKLDQIELDLKKELEKVKEVTDYLHTDGLKEIEKQKEDILHTFEKLQHELENHLNDFDLEVEAKAFEHKLEDYTKQLEVYTKQLETDIEAGINQIQEIIPKELEIHLFKGQGWR